MKKKTLVSIAATAIAAADASQAQTVAFGDQLSLLRKHSDVVVLKDDSGDGQVAVVPGWQGRVMTSTAAGLKGTGYGWVNNELIESGKVQPHINVYGGEDRFWLGPEGGQFSIFFAKGVKFDLEHWFTPASLDTEPFTVTKKSKQNVVCSRRISLSNYSGTKFDLEVEREVRLVDAKAALRKLGVKLPASVNSVGYESVNTVKNVGPNAWKKETGLLSIWILGMLNAAPETTVVIPFKKGPASVLGPKVNDAYFGKIPADRLVVKDDVLFFKGDANSRGKIGIPPRRAQPILGSYDPINKTLTIVQVTLPEGATDYVNSMWELQKNPYSGDAINSYNDGPPAPGAEQLGKFYELESSSPALALASGKSATHTHQTIHLQGDEAALDPVAQATLGVSLKEITEAFKK